MLRETEQEELTKKQIEEYILKRSNIKIGNLGLLAMIVGKREPYIFINDREESHSIFQGKKITLNIEVNLDYSLNKLDCKLIEKIFNSNPKIKVFLNYAKHKSTYAHKEIRRLSDINEILDLAEKYHRIMESPSYKTMIESYHKSINNLSDNLVEKFSEILVKEK